MTMTDDDDEYDLPAEEQRWLFAQRRNIQQHLDDQGVRHAGVAFEPVWSVIPYISVWTVRSAERRGANGFWAISGDTPTDHLPGDEAADATAAMTAFAKRWRSIARYMLRGREHPNFTLGGRHQRRERGVLLMRQAEDLASLVGPGFPEDDRRRRRSP